MPIVAEETVTGSVDGGSSVSLSSWTPQADELVLLAVAVRDESVTLTPSGNNLIWVQVADVDNVQGQNGITVFRAMGASPTAGQIQVSASGSTVIMAVATRFSGVDTSGSNGSGAVEASYTNSGPDPDDNDMVVSVTTQTAGAWAWAAGTYRGNTFTVPADETGISVNNLAGSGGDRVTLSTWYKEISSAGAAELGEADDLSSDADWCTIGVSIKPLSTEIIVDASPGVVSVSGPVATLDATTTIAAGTAALQLVGIQAGTNLTTRVQAGAAQLQLAGNRATISAPLVVSATPGSVSVAGVAATVHDGSQPVIFAGTALVSVVGLPVFVDTVRYLLDLKVTDEAAYSVALQGESLYALALQDEAPYAVELVDASRS